MSEPTELVFTISADVSPERLEEYKAALNELLGMNLEWETRMSETIPEEIRATARKVAHNLSVRCTGGLAQGDDSCRYHSIGCDASTEAIALAILAERERAAKIAEDEAKYQEQFEDDCAVVVFKVASMIRHA